MSVISLTVPRDPQFFSIVRLVCGGMATRLDLSIERLEEFRLAMESIAGCKDTKASSPLTVTIEVSNTELSARMGPFDSSLSTALTAEDDQNSLSLTVLLTRLIDRYELEEQDGSTYVKLCNDL